MCYIPRWGVVTYTNIPSFDLVLRLPRPRTTGFPTTGTSLANSLSIDNNKYYILLNIPSFDLVLRVPRPRTTGFPTTGTSLANSLSIDNYKYYISLNIPSFDLVLRLPRPRTTGLPTTGTSLSVNSLVASIDYNHFKHEILHLHTFTRSFTINYLVTTLTFCNLYIT